MSTPDILSSAQALQTQGRPYALVTVLRVLAPASARPGDKAVVTAEGISAGWIGGGCAQPAVMRTVRQALQDGRARVIRIAPAGTGPETAEPPPPDGPGSRGEADPTRAGEDRELADILEFGMACHSGGTLELFVDPMLPAARLTVIGDTPLAAALTGLAPRVGLPVTVVAHGAEAARFPEAVRVLPSDEPATIAAALAPGSFVVVATQGRRDVQGLRAALALQAAQVFFVASARKAEVLKATLIEAGADPAAVRGIVAPAGHAIGAQTPEEIALSVLAAVVAARRGAFKAEPASAVEAMAAAPARKPLAAPAMAGSCCGGGAAEATEAIAPAAPLAVAGTPSRSCCGT